MNAGEFIGLFLVILVLGAGVTGLALLLDVLFSKLVRRARHTAEKMPLRSALVGFVNFLFFGILCVASFGIAQELPEEGGRGLLILFSLLILLILSAFLGFGLAASARWVGERIAPEASATRQLVSGIVTLELASLAPFVGWVLVPLFAFLVGYGAVIIALVWRRET